ncbi:MAG: NAD(P)/FAD-dependent oxidoreductase [Flavobacteriales bacterium]|nr:NAD(P)/FAD-dependent oxidoreductase [Flavobacteriales bacterium]
MKKKVIIIGGGFAGLQLAKNLNKHYFDILLLDRLNHHQFQPLFYQVAASQIEPSSISFPLRHVFSKNKSVQIRLTEVKRIIPSEHKVETGIGDFIYDYLVVATGCKTNFYNNPSIEKNTFTLKSTYDAIAIRNHINLLFEKVISVTTEEKSSLLNLVIVGGGPTGVELAGAFAEIKCDILPRDYPGIDFSEFSVYLIEGSKHTLNNMSEMAKKASQRYLEKMGVKIITETIVKDYDGTAVTLSNGETIVSKTVIWTAGVIGNKTEGIPEEYWTPSNRIIVNRMNQIDGLNSIFAIGDIAYMITPNYPKGHPQLANVAINQAKLLAKNLERILEDHSLLEYEYKNLGTMATIGRKKAVVDFPFIKFKGLFAWIVWMFLHLMLILSARNKLIIFINWAWNYVTKNSSIRLILSQINKV